MPDMSMLIGVNAGYNKNAAITLPALAQELVHDKIATLDADGNSYTVHPGLVIYRTEWDCPRGGEAVGAVVGQGDAHKAIALAEQLRAAFDQSTVSVTTNQSDAGTPTPSFDLMFNTPMGLKAIGTYWQQAAEEAFNQTGIYISCGIYALDSGRVKIMAAQNPLYADKEPAADWHHVAITVYGGMQSLTILPQRPVLGQTFFTYLRKPAATNSRGE